MTAHGGPDSGPGMTVRVPFRRDQAKYVRERLWHPSQTFEDHPDGSLTLTLRVADTAEAQP
jgi:hypothetical protein